MSDCIKNFILPEYITNKEVCERELYNILDNIDYLKKLRLQYLKKYAELTNQKVYREQVNCNCTYNSYHVTKSKEDIGVDFEIYGELDIIDDVIKQNFIEEIK